MEQLDRRLGEEQQKEDFSRIRAGQLVLGTGYCSDTHRDGEMGHGGKGQGRGEERGLRGLGGLCEGDRARGFRASGF